MAHILRGQRHRGNPNMDSERLIQATCPQCRGPLTEVRTGDICEYRCLVGHVYSPRTMLQAHSEAQEDALWAAVVALEEAAVLVGAVKSQLPPEEVARLEEQAIEKGRQAAEIRNILERLEPFELE
jgi:two-component system, chemotaxis family, protein-glutamate methylesterase/glutaminase